MTKKLSKKEAAEISGTIKALKLNGWGGACGAAAIEINKKIFGGRGKYLAGLNEFWLDRSRPIGHVVVSYADRLWDSNGETSRDDVLSWGMLAPDDPDYQAFGWDDEEASNAVMVEFDDEKELRRKFPWKGAVPRTS